MSGGNWNRAGRKSGGSRPFVLPCSVHDAKDADGIVDALIGQVADIEVERGIKIDWMKRLPAGADGFTAREIVNAIGIALTDAGVPNNLVREVTT